MFVNLNNVKGWYKMWLKHNKLNEHEQKLVDMTWEQFDKYMMSNYEHLFFGRKIQEGQEVLYPMNFGFEIGPGWRHVLDSLCSKLEIIRSLTGYVCVFDQIKEKYGGARFYYHIDATGLVEEANKDRDNKICSIIDDLVSHYEEYCDYVCEELGTNVHPEDKIVIGNWYYGSGIDGFKKIAPERWGKYADERIKMAEEYVKIVETLKKIKSDLRKLNKEEIAEIEKFISAHLKEKL
jgi:hypothetical protein